MTAPRDDILTTVRPQDRIPSHGTQLSADGTADLTGEPVWTGPRDLADHRNEWEAHLRAVDAYRAAAYLNLWDTSPDSLPETWSLDR
jgi:hypothetical protein